MSRSDSTARQTRPVILYVVTEDWYFWSHRVDLARAARDAGYHVVVATRTREHRNRIEAEAFECVDLPFERSMRKPWRDLQIARRVHRLIRDTHPVLVHLVALKPMLLSALAVLVNPQTKFLHAATGLGYVFSQAGLGTQLIRWIVRILLRTSVNRKNCWLLVQNEDDRTLLHSLGIGTPRRTRLIAGSGVDTKTFVVTPYPVTEPALVILPARMLRHKGIIEFVHAAAIVRKTLPTVRFALVGPTDPSNPAAFTDQELRSLSDVHRVEWWGACSEMHAIYAAAFLVCLPSYREGIPKVLLEAAACGRPIVTVDTPGCRDVCHNGVNGILVPAADSGQLAQAILSLLEDPALAAAMGRAGRALVETRYSSDIINAQTLELYAEIIAEKLA